MLRIAWQRNYYSEWVLLWVGAHFDKKKKKVASGIELITTAQFVIQHLHCQDDFMNVWPPQLSLSY